MSQTEKINSKEFNNADYFVYVIKCVSDNTYYVGVSNSVNVNYNPLKWMFNQNKHTITDYPKYVKLSEAVRKCRMSGFKTIITKHRGTKEECERTAYDMLLKIGSEKYLNDEIVEPTRYECDKCGKSLKVVYKELHDEKYCIVNIEEELEQFY